MVLKVKGRGKNDWNYFECDEVNSHYGTLKKDFKFGDSDIFIADKDFDLFVKNQWGINMVNLVKNGRHIRNIITDKTCYLLNDDGKTIDRI